jgi:hypothetical protein
VAVSAPQGWLEPADQHSQGRGSPDGIRVIPRSRPVRSFRPRLRETSKARGCVSGLVAGTADWRKKDYEKIPICERVEVASLLGDIADDPEGEPALHIHIVVGTRDGSAKAGILAKGTSGPRWKSS